MSGDVGSQYTPAAGWAQGILYQREVLGKRVVDVFPFLRESGNEPCFTTVLEGKETISENHPYGPSETGVFESHYSPLRDENDEIVGGIATSHTPTIAFAKDANKFDDPIYKPKKQGTPPTSSYHFTSRARRWRSSSGTAIFVFRAGPRLPRDFSAGKLTR